MKGFNYDVSTLFSGLNNNANNGINLSDYKSIKNGSYGKLLKSYYAKNKNTDSTTQVDTNKNNKTTRVDKTGLAAMKKTTDSLSDSLKELKNDKIWSESSDSAKTDAAKDGIKSFIKNYNNVLDQSNKVTSKDVAQSVDYMKRMTSTMSKALSKVGIDTGVDGKLSLNEDTFEKADIKSVKALFEGDGSYGAQISERANEAGRNAMMSSSVYNSQGVAASTLSGMFDNFI